MTGSAPTTDQAPLPTSFEELNAVHRLRTIGDAAELQRAFEVLDRFIAAPNLTQDQEDYFTTLLTLIAAYEQEQKRSMSSSPTQALAELCSRHNLTTSALGQLLGNRALGSKLLRGERELSKSHIRTLRARYGVSADELI